MPAEHGWPRRGDHRRELRPRRAARARGRRRRGNPVLAARRAERLDALTLEIRNADPVVCDVTDEADRERLIDGVIERHGRLDGLVNNAGSGATAPALRTLDRDVRERARPRT